MMKRFFSAIIVFIPVLLFAQAGVVMNNSTDILTVPVETQYSDRFKISPIYFNKRIDPVGIGEILEVEMIFENLTDDPMELNVFTIATIEVPPKSDSSFELPVDKWDIIRFLVASPNDVENFKYQLKDKDGNAQKDDLGRDMYEYKKIPHDAKKGNVIKLDDNTFVLRTYHLCKYRKKYAFFNELAILVFNTEGQPLFASYYKLDKKRK
ncbi:MAG: hypothetical protein LBT84_07075 [Spirochaetia bacterium]|jgi:hypothetical protein|nr:hypothetical protein [Spirochaetia bacterium]